MATPTAEEAIARYVAYFESLAPDSVAALKDIARADLHFRDPFNDVHTVEATIAILSAMFVEVDEPRFRVNETVREGERAFLRWTFFCRTRGKSIEVDGSSYIRLDENNRIAEHIDYWDAASQFYENIPLLGWILRKIKSRLAHSE